MQFCLCQILYSFGNKHTYIECKYVLLVVVSNQKVFYSNNNISCQQLQQQDSRPALTRFFISQIWVCVCTLESLLYSCSEHSNSPFPFCFILDGFILADGFAIFHRNLSLVGSHLFAFPVYWNKNKTRKWSFCNVQTSNHYVVHQELTQSCRSIILKNKQTNKQKPKKPTKQTH